MSRTGRAAGITVVSGPSGAGKTTLLRLCNRLEVLDGGRVCYRGRPLDELDPLDLRRRVGMVFQRPTPFPGSVADNLAVARPDAGTGELSTALKRVALDPGLLGQEALTLSGGELQRMCLARTLVTQPETLLLDEPTSALDAQPKQVFESTARDLAARGGSHLGRAVRPARLPAHRPDPGTDRRDDDRELDDRDRAGRAAPRLRACSIGSRWPARPDGTRESGRRDENS